MIYLAPQAPQPRLQMLMMIVLDICFFIRFLQIPIREQRSVGDHKELTGKVCMVAPVIKGDPAWNPMSALRPRTYDVSQHSSKW